MKPKITFAVVLMVAFIAAYITMNFLQTQVEVSSDTNQEVSRIETGYSN